MDNTQPTTPTVPPTPPATEQPTTTPPVPPTAPAVPPAEPEHHGGLPWKTIVLILVLIAVVAGLLYVALGPKFITKQAVTPVPTPTISPAHTVLALTQTAASQSGTPALAVTIDTSTNTVTGVQFEIAYDPAVVSNVVVTQGDFLPQPTILINAVDTKNGRISYAAVLSPTAKAVTGKGVVATISYTLAPTTPTISQTTLKFLPKTKVTQDDVLDSVLKSTTDITLPLSRSDKLPTAY